MNDAVVPVSLPFPSPPSCPPPVEAGEFGVGGILPTVLMQLTALAPSAISCLPVAFFPCFSSHKQGY